jgi:hypothetical protein
MKIILIIKQVYTFLFYFNKKIFYRKIKKKIIYILNLFSKIKTFIILGENVIFDKYDMETIINQNSKEQSTKTSENICDVPSAFIKEIPSSLSSSSFVLSHQSNKQEKNSFYSLKNLSQRSNSIRRSTINCSSSFNNDNIENKNLFPKTISHQSIDIIKENNSNQYLYEKNLSKSNQQSTPTITTTRIKLSLPVLTTGLNPRRRYLNRNREGEFTLPTNPPITVTIQPQTNINNNNNDILIKENSLHDDQLCSPEHINSVNDQRISLDPSLKGASTIVNYFMDLLKPSDNKLAMKLFGSRKGVLKERLRQQRAGHCIIHPCSNFR